jgi:hypothetical protein
VLGEEAQSNTTQGHGKGKRQIGSGTRQWYHERESPHK